MRKVAIVIMAANADPVKKKALNREPSRALSLGCANSLIKFEAPTIAGVMPTPMTARDTINIAVFWAAVSAVA